jgi:hypothetical protein
MKILDLTVETHSAMQYGLKEYEMIHPDLFAHYFRYWANRENFSDNIISRNDLELRRELVCNSLQSVIQSIEDYGLPADSITVILFTGQNTSNGHAFMNKDEITVWIPVETYHTTLQAQVFLTHEIIHGIHYLLSPDFSFGNESERVHTGRQLITEGVATYFTMRALGISESEALWADFLSEQKIDEWIADCRRRLTELKAHCRKTFSNSDGKSGLFHADDPSDIFRYRAGYFVGLEFVKWMADKQRTEHEILQLPRRNLEQSALAYVSF